MRRPKKDIQLTSYDELLGLEETPEKSMNQVVEIDLAKLYPFKNHPFHVNDDEKMAETVESIKTYGVLTPALVRPRSEGGYEMISGHRRKRGCELCGKTTMPALVRNYTDDEAVIIMVDSNIQRENLLPSEKAHAYKMKYDAMKHQGSKGKKYTADMVGEAAGDSGRTVQRYIRLAALSDALLEYEDDKARTDFIKEKYGIGGQSHALCGADNSHADYDGKGLKLERGDYGNPDTSVLLPWVKVAKRIGYLIDNQQFLRSADYSRMPEYERERIAGKVISFYARLPEEIERPSKQDFFNEEARKELPVMLNDSEQSQKLLQAMDD